MNPNNSTIARELLAELELLLRAERAAVAALELDALEPLAARKELVCLKLAGITIPRGLAPEAGRVRALAEANAELLKSSAEAIAELISPPVAPAVYDARARVRRSGGMGLRVTRV